VWVFVRVALRENCNHRSTTSTTIGRLRRKAHASRMLEDSIVGSVETVRRELVSLVALTKADELMVVSSL
jgi:hypothetical protein